MDGYTTALDDKTRLDHMVQTIVGGLRVSVEDVVRGEMWTRSHWTFNLEALGPHCMPVVFYKSFLDLLDQK
jgi:hypothetical protein